MHRGGVKCLLLIIIATIYKVLLSARHFAKSAPCYHMPLSQHTYEVGTIISIHI